MRVSINSQAIRELLRGAEVQADLLRRAEAIAAAAGEGHVAEIQVGKVRARASVRTATPQAASSERSRKTLTQAIGAGHG